MIKHNYQFLDSVTFCITSCNRNDLLFKTIDSFIETNAYPEYIFKWLIREDSGIESVAKEIMDRYPFFEVEYGTNIGQGESIDILYDKVCTEYIFHCEEDWYFNGNKEFLKQSLEILEEYKDIYQVWIRKNMSHWAEFFRDFKDFNFGIVKDKHLDMWNGFSWNPGLRRLTDYNTMFPEGFKKFITTHRSGGILERDCMLHSRKFNYKAAILKDCVCEHIGDKNKTIKE